MRSACIGFAVLLAAGSAVAQSINVDFGSAGSPPLAAYGAQGLAGTWNEVGVLPPAQRVPLVDVTGAPSGIELYMIGGTALYESDDPATVGDDAALLDDMLIGYNDPVDVCVWFANVPAGEYEVILYGLTPSDPTLQHRLRVDYAVPGATMCGGAWAGLHLEGVSFVRFRVYTESGYVGLHSGLQGALITSGLNGVQLRANPPAGTEPPGIDASRSRVVNVFPNPASGPSAIEFTLGGADRDALLTVVDVAGHVVWRHTVGAFAPGRHAVAWDGRDARGGRAPAGVYFARLAATRAGDAAAVRVVRVPPASR
jgi:hypothetical protein